MAKEKDQELMPIPKGYIPNHNFWPNGRKRNLHSWELLPGAQLCMPWGEPNIPSFDMVLELANDYGTKDVVKILGAELVDSGIDYSPSIDDIVSEHSYTYVAYPLSLENGRQLKLPGVE